MISFWKNVWHNSLYLHIKGEFEFLKSSKWFSLRINFTRRYILTSPGKLSITNYLLQIMTLRFNCIERKVG